MVRTLVTALFALLSFSSHSAPVNYQLDIEITNITEFFVAPVDSPYYPCSHGIDCSNPLGHHTGFFSIDSSVLEHEGFLPIVPLSFYFKLNDTVWDSTRPVGSATNPSAFAGYDFACDSTDGMPPPFGCTRTGWTVHVHAGVLETICCGVFGSGDLPFVDLSGGPPGLGHRMGVITQGTPIVAPDGAFVNLPFVVATGDFSFQLLPAQVPEPPSGWLMLLALGVLAGHWRRAIRDIT